MMDNLYVIDNITLNANTHGVTLDAAEVRLTVREFELLYYLIRHKECVCTRDAIIDEVFGIRFQYDTGVIDVHINSLRRKLKQTQKNGVIKTIRGVGFMLCSCQKSDSFEQNLQWAKLFTSHLPNELKTCHLQTFIFAVLNEYAAEIMAKKMQSRVCLTPFVNEIITNEATLHAIFDTILRHLLQNAISGGTLTVSSELKLNEFSFTFKCTGVCADWQTSELIAAQRFAALIGMSLRMDNRYGNSRVQLVVSMQKL